MSSVHPEVVTVARAYLRAVRAVHAWLNIAFAATLALTIIAVFLAMSGVPFPALFVALALLGSFALVARCTELNLTRTHALNSLFAASVRHNVCIANPDGPVAWAAETVRIANDERR